MAAISATLPAAIHSSVSLRCDAGFNPRRVYPDVSLPRTRLIARTSRNSSVAASSPPNSGPASPPTLPEPLIPLGQSELRVSPLGIGTLQWGDPRSGFGEQYSAADLAEAFRAALAGGINLFDSAEVYGYQSIPTGNSSEQLLGRFVAEEKARRLQEGSNSSQSPAPVAASKFFTIPWTNLLVGGGLRFGRQSLIDALKASLQRLGMERVDLYQIHFPFPTISNATLMDGLKQAHAEGLATAVGVSNYNTQQLQEAHSLLKAANIPLASNQVKFNLLDRGTETNGLLHTCKDLQVSLIAYSPLASGLLTDKALTRSDKDAVRVRPLLQLMKAMGEEYGGKSVSQVAHPSPSTPLQVALNYIMCKGAIPIPGYVATCTYVTLHTRIPPHSHSSALTFLRTHIPPHSHSS
ncbi:unnamed protein product [Closterium sp. Naga37s-1]|nr:unnamed protein product [Closterium sp. Naga37s-1]